MQADLFQQPDRESPVLSDGSLLYFRRWLPDSIAWRYFYHLNKYCQWEQSTIRMGGRSVKIPRLNAWYGEPHARYRYSGKTFQPLPWIRALAALREHVHRKLSQENLSTHFNSALINLYRDGNDSVAWHADNESELGPNPVIASISLGATRRFVLKKRNSSEKYQLELEHGSLLLMLPPLQRFWLHSLPKTKVTTSPRINVTFRDIIVH